MASWLASQLKAAESLLEAVDRTVSTATGATSHSAGAPELGAQSQKSAFGDANGLQQHTAESTSGNRAQSVLQTGGSPKYGSPSFQQALNSTSSSPFKASVAGALPAAAVTGPPPPMFQQRPWQPALPAVAHNTVTSPAAAPLTLLKASQLDTSLVPSLPVSTGSYTVRQHGPFSPSPDQTQWQAQHDVGSGGVTPASNPLVHTSLPAAGSSSAGNEVSGQHPFGTMGIMSEADAASEQSKSQSNVSHSTPEHVSVDTQPHSSPNSLAAAALPTLDSGPASVALTGQEEQQRGSRSSSSDAQPLEATSTIQQQVDDVIRAPPGFVDAMHLADSDMAAAATTLQQHHELQSQQDVMQPAEQLAPSAEQPQLQQRQQQVFASQQAPQQQQQHQQSPPGAAAAARSSSSSSGPPSSGAGAPPALFHTVTVPPAHNTPEEHGSNIAGPGSGASAKEAQLTRLIETLRKRLDQVKAENQQLEDLLHAAEQRTAAEQQRAQRMETEAVALQRVQDDLITSAAANAAAQDARINKMQQDLEASHRQVTALQQALEAIQEQHQQILSSKDSIEGGALEALRAEVAAAEGQLESERKAHAATKAAATTRERDLEEQLSSSSEALAATQRQLHELASRSRDLEEQHALAAAEAGRLKEKVRQLDEQQSSSLQQSDPALLLHLEAEKEALAAQLTESQAAMLAASQAQRAAEAQLASLQHEVAQLQHNLQQAASTRSSPQLEQQVAELQELLYQKQQQLERLSGEKQGQLLMLERQVHTLRSELGKAHAAAAAAATNTSSGRGAHDIIPMDALGEPYQRLARHRKLGGAVQATANFLDRTTASVSQLLRQQPLARLAVFLYLVLIHIYVYFLLARMQRQAVLLIASQESKAAAAAGQALHDTSAPSLPH